MTTYRAKLIVERVELRRPIIRGTEVPKEAIYDEIRIEITSNDSDTALNKVIALALAEQADRGSRKAIDALAKKLAVDDMTDDDEDEN